MISSINFQSGDIIHRVKVCSLLVSESRNASYGENKREEKKEEENGARHLPRPERVLDNANSVLAVGREGVVAKTGDEPLTGTFMREHEELMVLVSNTVLDLAHPNHMREALASRRMGMAKK